ncbi:addiction module protein [Halocola ammonii]
MKHLGFEISDETETSHDYEIPEEHKQIVRERMKHYEQNPGSAKKWDDIKDKSNLDD